MKYHFNYLVVLMAMLVFSSVLLAQKPDSAAARTPDFSGIWMVEKRTNVFDAKEDFSPQPWAAAKIKEVKKELDPVLSCFPYGIPRLLLMPVPFEIIQLPGRVLMMFESDHSVRNIHMDGRKHPNLEELSPLWMGHSIGRWDGDTLVVDTVGLNDQTWVDYVGHPHTEALHLVERYRRVDHNTLVLEITVEDPKAYTKPYTGRKVYKLHPDWEIMENTRCEDRLKLEPHSY